MSVSYVQSYASSAYPRLNLEEYLIQNNPFVTIVTPISGVDIDLSNLRYWLKQTPGLPIKTVIIHDELDQLLQVRLEEMLEEINNPLVFLHRGNFGSPGAARNKGLEFVTTAKVVFWDADDIGEPNNLIKVIKDHEDSKVIVGSYTTNSDSGIFKPRTIVVRNDHTLGIQLGINPGIWRYIFDLSVIGKYPFSSIRMGEDQQFLIEIQSVPEKLVVTKTILYNYFTGSNNHLTAQQSAKSEVFFTFKAIQKFFIQRPKKLNLFETTIYLKLIWSTIRHSKKSQSIGAFFACINLAFVFRKIVFRNVAKIVSFLIHKEQITHNEN